MRNLNYNKKLKPFARKNRKESTKAEIRLWCEVLKSKKTGYSFFRQRPVDRFIVDFMCKELKLVIEVDGITHNWKIEEDKQREKELMNLGFCILRFRDEDVMDNIEGVAQLINLKIEEMKTRLMK